MTNNIKKRFHPGEFIKDGIEALDITADQFAIRSGLTSKTVSQLINGQAKVNFGTAKKISAVIGGEPKTWLNLQNSYDLYLSELDNAKELESQEEVAKLFPKNTLNILNIELENNLITGKIKVLKSHFNVNNLNALKNPDFYNCCHHQSQKIETNDRQVVMQNAWINYIITSAQKSPISTKIDLKKLKQSCGSLRKSSMESKEKILTEIKRILNECGIMVVFSSYVPYSNISGFTKWTKDRENVILGLNDSGKRLDKFFFTLFHEISHVLNGDKRYIHLTYTNAESNADQFAMNHLITHEEYNELLSLFRGVYTPIELKTFSDKLGIDFSIVLGRLAHEGLINHKDYSKYYKNFEI